MRTKKASPSSPTQLFDSGSDSRPNTAAKPSPADKKLNTPVFAEAAVSKSPDASAEAKEVAELKELLSTRGASDTSPSQRTPPASQRGKKTAAKKTKSAKEHKEAKDDAGGGKRGRSASPGGSRGGSAAGKGGKGGKDDAAASLEFLMGAEQLMAIEARWEREAKGYESKAAAVPVDFERTLGVAIRKVAATKADFLAFVDLWDKDNIGLKKVDFRRQMRGTSVTGLKLTAGNHDIDKLFDSITGGAGAATATVKELTALLWPMAVKAGVTDPLIEGFLAEAAESRKEAESVRVTLEALEATEAAEKQLREQTGVDAPVVAQLGNLVQKRNMKVGEVIAKWGSVDHVSFRKHVRELGVVASDEKIDAVFDEIDDDGGGTLDADELKDGLKMLVDSAKTNDKANAALEKQALHLRKNAVAQINVLHKQELQREERLRVEAAAAEEAERLRLEAEAEAEKVAAAKKAEAEAAKKAEKAALLAQVAALKKAARGEKPKVGYEASRQGEEEGTHIKHVPQWEIDAEERRKAEEHWQLVKKSFKRSWRPPGLHGTH